MTLFEVHQSGERKFKPRGQENVPRLHLGAVRRGKVSDDFSVSPFPSHANFLSNIYFQGTSNNKSKLKRKKDRDNARREEKLEHN